ncbi:MAG: nucleoside-diphosphate sugar epimerase/dehydratase [Bacilli bacterium]|jgi:FlaA1/EpsC-like NDP-sugar epimerase
MNNQNRSKQALVHVLLDFLILALLLALVFWEQAVHIGTPEFTPTLLFFIGYGIFKLSVFALAGVYNMITNHFSIVDAIKVGIVSMATTAFAYIIMFLLPGVDDWNLVNFLTLAFSEAFLLITIRFAKRLLHMYVVRKDRSLLAKTTIVVGAGLGGKMIIDEIRNNQKMNNEVVAIVDDDPVKIGSSFSGVKVFGPISHISEFIKKFDAQEVIIAIANIEKNRLFDILSYMDQSNVKIKRLPLIADVSLDQKIEILEVDIHELLGRDVVPLENEEIRAFIKDKTVLITGAGGSIGSELARQVYKYHPKRLVMFDIYENGVYDIQQEFQRLYHRNHENAIGLDVIIGSTYNRDRIEQVFKAYRPELIFHAAAYKHVPLMEDCPQEAIRTNIIGTYNTAMMAQKYQAQKMVLVSTDKAVRPTNVMGATKAFAEMIIQHFNATSNGTSFSSVRFGNVLGSNGSVIPLFKKQIECGGPVTVTDPRITRYFMTIPEAVGLILQSGVYAKGGEIFVLDMGKPIRIMELAEKMIRQAGFIPHKDIKVEIIGLRPGEKLYEELLINGAHQIKTANEKIFIDTKKDIRFTPEAFAWFESHLNDSHEELVSHLFKSIDIKRKNEPEKDVQND